MGFFSFSSREKQDKRRLEGFMNALPLEYCGWGTDGTAFWSKGFPRLFDLATIQNIRDIQQAILPSDAAALEGMIFALKKDGEPFTLTVQTTEHNRSLTLYGRQGTDLDGMDDYDVLWVEDTTMANHEREETLASLDNLRKDIHEYRTVLDNLPLSVWITDDAGKLQWCNAMYERLVQAERDTLINEDDQFKPILTESHKISVQEMARQSMEAQEADTSTGRMIIDGKRRLLDIHITPAAKEQFIVHSAYDITEQEDLRAELKRYVTANAELLEKLSTAIAIFAADQKLEFYNQSFSSLWGLEEQWLNTNPPLGDILEKLREMRRLPEQSNFREYKKGWLDMFTALMDEHQDMLYLPDGVAIRLMIVPHPMGGLMMTFEDVTSRLELESSYNTLIAVQRETLDNLGEGVAVFGSDARLRLYNPSYLSLWKLNPEDTDKKPHINELAEKKKSFFKARGVKWDDIEMRLSASVINRSEQQDTITRTDGTVLECNAVALPDGGMMVTYRDVTDSVRVQQALEEKNRALLDAEKLKTDFLANVSYQLRTPLNVISGFSEILNNEYFGEINDKQREYTQGITDAAVRLASLIDDILDLSSIEAGYLRLDKQSVDIMTLMDNVLDLTRDWAGMESLKITFQKPKKSPGMLELDERRIKQTIINIIRNAISYTPSGGTITMSLTEEKDSVNIAVQDTGIGIPEDEQDTIFEPFKTVTGDEEGVTRPNTGLGLSLAKNIVAMHGGDITVKSILGEGTTVTISLPK